MPRRISHLPARPAAPIALALAFALTLVFAFAAVTAKPAQAMTFAPCPGGSPFSCSALAVPLDRSSAVSGAVTLQVQRLQAGPAPSESAVVALAGGPGQAAIPLASELQATIAPALAARDLIVFDQRGTGSSGPLSCRALESEGGLASIGQAFERCALQIGPGRGSYTTQETVADIEALRQALGYRKLVLFGVSYGTKVALEYAERHPQSVEALLLDSVVAPERNDPFQLATFKAMASAFGELCSARACAGITGDALGDLGKLAARLHRHALGGYVYDGSGRRRRAAMSDVALLNLVAAGDLNPALRALLPASVASALRGDAAPLLRLNLLSEGLVPNVPGGPSLARIAGGERVGAAGALPSAAHAVPAAHASTGAATHASTGAAAHASAGAAAHASAGAATHASTGAESTGSDGVDEALFADTTCEEEPFPWQRSAPASTRVAEALATLRGLPASAFYPFSAGAEWADSVLPGCAQWPNVAAPPPAIAPLPSVPALILSGAQDVRTPTAGAEALAARIPGAHLVVVPYTGHSVLGSDFSGCAQAAVKAFFAGSAPQACTVARNLFSPTPITPTRLAYVKPVGGVTGRPGSTLAVVLETIVDLERQVIGATLQAAQQLPSGSSFGGLRGGYARLSPSSLRLRHLSFVPGVKITGSFAIVKGRLLPATIRVEGSLAARGSVRIGGPTVAGALGGRRFRVDLAKVRLASTSAPPPAGFGLNFSKPGLAHLR